MPSSNKTVTDTASLIASAKGGRARQWIRLEMRSDQAADVRVGIGDPAVTPSTGLLLRKGYGMLIENDTLSKPASHAIYAILASGSTSVTVTVTEGT